jgi:uncharacterized protein (TIGR02996 family)
LATELDPLLLAVYDDPGSDAKRAVYADALVERGEPLGEFIHLQLGKKRGSVKRAKEIFDPTWWRAIHPVGAIAGALELDTIERGFPWLMSVGLPAVDRPRAEAIAAWRPQVGHPGWSTIRDFSADDHPVVGEILTGTRMPLLEEVTRIGPEVLRAIARALLPLRSLQAHLPVEGALPVLEGLPSLRVLSIIMDAPVAVGIERARALGVLDRIAELAIHARDSMAAILAAMESLPRTIQRFASGVVKLAREPSSLELSLSSWHVDEACALLAALPAKRFVRVRVAFVKHGYFTKRERPAQAERIRAATKQFKTRELVLGD